MNMNPKFTIRRAEGYAQHSGERGMYKEFDATELYCPRCKSAVPVRKRLLLIVPEGDKYEYLCARCSTSVGTKIDKKNEQVSVII